MSVLIKGMQKPDRCIDCPFMISRDNDDCILQSDAMNELFMNWDDMKLNCPLVELPEKHGDLIDRDALKKDYRMGTDCNNCKTDWKSCQYDIVYAKMDFCGWLDDAPVVIEADRS